MKTKAILFFLSFILFISCESNEENTQVDEDGIITGLQTKTFSHDNVNRNYLVYIPNSYDSEIDYPLMFLFHGFGGIASEFMNTADMRDLAESKNFIVVYPQGLDLASTGSHWNCSNPSADNKSDVDDIGFIENLIDQLLIDYPVIDNKRIYAAGYSNGGFMSYYLACNSKKFAAIGSVAGTMLDDSYQNCNAQFPTAMINIHGTDDFDVPYVGNSYYPSIPDVVDWWKNFNNATNEDLLTNQDGTIEQYIYYDDAGDRFVEHIKVIGGGHYWDDKLNYEGKNTSGLIWEFVSNFDIDGVIN
jgi:polyhydroxybutyrate depolymerase|tara:strand:+ start:612 stop:1517 length:906 start_codon:yes stop_codon:yes gene_type:complete